MAIKSTNQQISATDEAQQIKKLGLAVIETEAQSVTSLRSRINDNFVKACQYMLECDGRVVVIGMGKSGHISNKIVATLASTGTPAFFVNGQLVERAVP